MDQNVERRIRDRAYSIWEREGCPPDRDVDHWLRAAQEIAAEESSAETASDAPTSASDAPASEEAKPEKPKKPRAPRASKSKEEKNADAPAPKGRKSSKAS